MTYIPMEIQRVLELEGAFSPEFNCPIYVYAHISEPAKKEGDGFEYALMAVSPQSGVMSLGDIQPRTRMFRVYDNLEANHSAYELASNSVVRKIMVPFNQVTRLRSLGEVLEIKGISVRRELVPRD